MFSTDCLVIDGHIAEVLESTDEIEGFGLDRKLAQHAAVFDDFEVVFVGGWDGPRRWEVVVEGEGVRSHVYNRLARKGLYKIVIFILGLRSMVIFILGLRSIL